MTYPQNLCTVDDLYEFVWLEDVQISPDGRWVAFVQVNVDRVRNCYRRTIYLAPSAGGSLRRFSAGQDQDYQPRWSPDGTRLAFVSNRQDKLPQIYLIRLDGGEAQRLTNFPRGATNPSWSPDGRMLAVLATSNADERQQEDATEVQPAPSDAWAAKRAQEEHAYAEAQRFDPRVVTKLPYRSGTTFFDDRHQHIYLLDVPSGDVATLPKPRRITHGHQHYTAPTWMPDGASILSTTPRDPEADSLYAYHDVVRIPVDGGAPQPLTSAGYSYFDPQPAPDGSLIAVARIAEDRLFTAGSQLVVIPAAGGPPQALTTSIDVSVEQFTWHATGQTIYLRAGWQGSAHIYAVALPAVPTASTHDQTCVGGERIISDFSIAQDGTIAFLAGSASNPCDLFVQASDGTERQITTINQAILASRMIAPIEEMRYTAPDGAEVQGWVIYPPNVDRTKHYPLAVHIHGGPHVMWGPGYRSMWHEWQTIAAAGYICFFCNPRGSEGYGRQWREAIHRNWGVADQPDILAGIDTLIAQGQVDPQRIAVTGGSYGGYMTAWLISHTDRFCCAVAARGVYNLLTEHSTSDAHELIEMEFCGYPWECYATLWDHSPLAHAHTITTPLLLLHSEHDYRVPISEAEQLFAILRRQKKTVELVRYPREGHELTRTGEPNHRADHMRRTLAWFNRYCQESPQ